jgi:carboxymethylenebutenolidase
MPEKGSVRAGMVDMESNTTLVQGFPAHQAVPAGRGPYPAVVVFHDHFGLTPSLRGFANRLAREGFAVLAPNFYALPSSFASVAPEFMGSQTVGSFELAEEVAALERARTLTDERAETISRQAVRYLFGRAVVRPGSLGVVGFGMGARLALAAACALPREVHAGVLVAPEGVGEEAPYPPGQRDPLERAGSLAAAVLLFYGQIDTEAREPERQRVRARLATLGKAVTLEVLRGAGPGFFFSDREGYRAGAARAVWEKTVAFLRGALPPLGSGPV